MDLKAQLLYEHSKANCRLVVEWVGDSQKRFDALYALFEKGEYRVTQRAAWPLSFSVAEHPKLISKHIGSLLRYMRQPNLHNAIRRNGVRLLQYVTVPEEYQGELMDICFEFVASVDEPVAVKAFSLTILANLAQSYPEIIPEIRVLIEDQLPSQSPAFTNRAKKLLKEWDKQKK